jgi:hypothetical protein
MITFDLAFENYVKSLVNNVLMPYGHTWYYLNNFKPEYIENQEDREKYLIIFDEGALTRIHPDFTESGTKAFFFSFITPIIENRNSLKVYKEQLDDLADSLRFNNVEMQDADGIPLFNVTTTIGDATPIENTTQHGIRYLFQMSVSAVYQTLQDHSNKLVAIREEERKVEISLDGGATYTEVKGKLAYQKGNSTDLSIFPVNNERVAQNYRKQRRKTHTLQVIRGKSGIVEQLYQLYELANDSNVSLKLRVRDYVGAPQYEYDAKLTQVVENGEYGQFNSTVFTFEINKVVGV